MITRIIVNRTESTENHIIITKSNEKMTNAICRYGTALQKEYNDIVSINVEGSIYSWVGFGRKAVS